MNKAPDLPEREPSVAATESLVRPQNEQTLEPSSSPSSAAPAFTPPPPNQAATLVTSHRIRPDGTPIPTAPVPLPLRPDSAPPLAEAPKTAAPSVSLASDQARRAANRNSTVHSRSAHSAPPLAEAPKTAAAPAASQMVKPDGCQSQQRRPLPLRPIQRRLWLRRQRRRPRRRPHKWSSRTGAKCNSAVHPRFD